MKIGSLFTGYGGLDIAAEAAFGATTAWTADIDPGACKIISHRFPDVPNLGDISAVDWSTVEPVDIITGGSPCQDLSHAGKRAGMTEGTRSNLWVGMREAIAELRPQYVIWENVRGAYSAPADSELESRPGLLDRVRRRDGEPVLRALGRVLGDLSDLGYDCQWRGLRATDVGAPHGRFRVFLLATDARRVGGSQAVEHDGRGSTAGHRSGVPDESDRDACGTGPERVGLLPTPTSSDSNGGGQHGDGGLDLRTAVSLLEHGNGNRHGASLAIEAQRLLPTPSANEPGYTGPLVDEDGRPVDHVMQRTFDPATGRMVQTGLNQALSLLPTPRASDGPDASSHGRTWSSTDHNLHNVARNAQFGQYAAAIARWESVLGRPAPAPTEPTGKNGAHRLSPAFVNWMMGLPEGWVTDVPDLSRNAQLKALGNGVVSAQAYAALVDMLDAIGAAA